MIFGRNSTIGVKEKICVSCGKPCIWFSKRRCQQCAKVEDTMKRMEAANEVIIKEEDLSGLIEDADTIFSRFIRLKYANENGIVVCYTCPTFKHWTMMQAGHYIKRAHLYLRWEENNVKPQCRECNEMKYGNIEKFREHLDKDNPGISEILFDQCKLVYKPTREEIRQVISEYTPKVKMLLGKLKL